MSDLAIYIHWPFCKSKCPYCDFNSHVSDSIDHKQWVQSYLAEISYFSEFLCNKTIGSIFFGGGTPTLMPTFIAENIINKLAKHAKFADNIEITLEGNPTSIEAGKFKQFKNAGINRVSLGVQSLNNNDLRFLGREHDCGEALRAVETAGEIFANYSFDLIYARPGQSLQAWEAELKQALKYAKNHLSLYQLTIEKGTQFYGEHKKGKFTMPGDGLSADLYSLTLQVMQSEGFCAYEVSNYAKPGFESKHNMTYWQYGDYLGIGPGAHSRITIDGKKNAQMMICSPDNWLKSVKEKNNGIQSLTTLTNDEVVQEAIMMGMRIKEGINVKNFEQITGYKLAEKINNIDFLVESGLIKKEDNILRATKKGMLLINSVIAKLLG